MDDLDTDGGIERRWTARGWIVFAPAILNDVRFERELASARDRGCRIDYAVALANARDVYREYLSTGCVN